MALIHTQKYPDLPQNGISMYRYEVNQQGMINGITLIPCCTNKPVTGKSLLVDWSFKGEDSPNNNVDWVIE